MSSLIVCRLEKISPTALEICFAVRASSAKTYLGKTRAFIRMALMQVMAWQHFSRGSDAARLQKCLAEQIRAIVELPTLLEWCGIMHAYLSCEAHLTRYEPHAFMARDEGSVVAGLLHGISIIDCTFDMKVRVVSHRS